MSNKPFHYQTPFPLKKDGTEYYLLTSEHASVSEFEGQRTLRVAPETLTLSAHQALHDASFMSRPAHQQQVAGILHDPEASKSDRYVALRFLCNSGIIAKGILPTCQDIGTAITVGKKGQRVWTGGGDEAALARGVYNTYIGDNLRCSQNTPLDIYKGVDTGASLPVQTDLYVIDSDEYEFLCTARGGGSTNKTYLHREVRALLTPRKLKNYLVEKMCTLGTAACPPYHIAFVIGGTSVEANLKTVKPISARYYDELSTEGNEHGQALRDVELGEELLIEAQNPGLGAQFDGRYFVHDIRVIRLPRHGASCPAGMGIFCSADHDVKAKINHQGIWIEKLEYNPGKYIPEESRKAEEGEAVRVDLNRPMKEILAQLSQYPVFTRSSLNGAIIVGRNIVHIKLKEWMDNGGGPPQYIRDHPICCAGPAKVPEGYTPGSLSPTTIGRMDPYIDQLQVQGESMIMLAKGSRGQQAADTCKKHGGFYLGNIGGPAAVLAQRNIKSLECVEYPELGMEAIWKIEVEDFPTFILVDNRGNDFFQQIQLT